MIGLVAILGDPPVPIHLDQAETRLVIAFYRAGNHGDLCVSLEVPLDRLVEVELVDVVGAHHHENVRVEVAHDRLIPVDRVGVPLVETALLGAEVRMQ